MILIRECEALLKDPLLECEVPKNNATVCSSVPPTPQSSHLAG